MEGTLNQVVEQGKKTKIKILEAHREKAVINIELRSTHDDWIQYFVVYHDEKILVLRQVMDSENPYRVQYYLPLDDEYEIGVQFRLLEEAEDNFNDEVGQVKPKLLITLENITSDYLRNNL